jgi:hypothetical protein
MTERVPDVCDLHAPILRLPFVVGGLADCVFTANINRFSTTFNFSLDANIWLSVNLDLRITGSPCPLRTGQISTYQWP